MPDADVIKLLAGGSAATLLAVAVVALLNEWVYTRGRFKEMKADRDMWRRIALQGKNVLSKVEDVIEPPE